VTTLAPTPKLSIERVSKVFEGRSSDVAALEDVSIDVSPGEFLVIVGPSGCGKSTLLDLLAGLSAPTSGRLLVDGAPITGPGPDRGVVFQQYALLPWRTALRNIEFGLEGKGLTRRVRTATARTYLDIVGLSGFADRYPHELSGGMRQRVAIARALAFDPDVLLMDEPFAALDAQTRETLQDELLRIWKATSKTVVFITHSIDEAVYLGRRVAVLTSRPGRIKAVVDVDLGDRKAAEDGAEDVTEDVRSTPLFAEYRHRIWSELHGEVVRAQRSELSAREVVSVG
jgi:NitT/TauT family transport system ATP-binding protein